MIETMSMNKQQIRMIVIVICVVILLSGGFDAIMLGTFGDVYTTGYQGAHARFVGVEYEGEQHKQGLWDTTFNFDPETAGLYVFPAPGGLDKPRISGEMTSVFIPSESVGTQIRQFQSGADISNWLLEATTINNPIEDYEWELPVNSETALYRMEEWQLKWYFSISCEPTRGEVIDALPFQNKRNSLKDVKVWFEFDLTPVWYFENQSNAYFAIAKLRISDMVLGGKISNEYTPEKNTESRVGLHENSIMPIYYGVFGTEANRAEKDAKDYKDKKLNPNLFTDKVYSYFTLEDFGVSSWWDFGTSWRADVVTVGVDFHVFVVGEWHVKDVQELPDEYGRDAKTGSTGVPIGEALIRFFGSPTGQMWALIGLAAIIFLLLALFAPWALFAIFGLFGSGRKK